MPTHTIIHKVVTIIRQSDLIVSGAIPASGLYSLPGTLFFNSLVCVSFIAGVWMHSSFRHRSTWSVNAADKVKFTFRSTPNSNGLIPDTWCILTRSGSFVVSRTVVFVLVVIQFCLCPSWIWQWLNSKGLMGPFDPSRTILPQTLKAVLHTVLAYNFPVHHCLSRYSLRFSENSPRCFLSTVSADSSVF